MCTRRRRKEEEKNVRGWKVKESFQTVGERQRGGILGNIRERLGDPVTIPKGDQALALNAEQRNVLWLSGFDVSKH